MFKKLINFILVMSLVINLTRLAFGAGEKIRVGHFPNVTHAPALIARATGHFEKSFGESVKIDWKTFTFSSYQNQV
jgi:NitT/TauT family transport system substrate-binding protein